MKKSNCVYPDLLGLAALACSGTLTGITGAPVYVCPTPVVTLADTAADSSCRSPATRRSSRSRLRSRRQRSRPMLFVRLPPSIAVMRCSAAARNQRAFA